MNIRGIVYWGIDMLQGSPMKKILQDITVANEVYDENRENLLITKLLEHACATTEAYADYKGKSINQIPLATKVDYKNHYNKYVSSKFIGENNHKMSTSGSTGTPFIVVQDKNKRRRVLGELIYFNKIVGQNIGDKFVYYRVWTDKNRKNKLEQIKQNMLPVDILYLDKNNLQDIIDNLQRDKKINSSLAYASTYDEIYHYLQENKVEKSKFNIKVMISGSELLLDSTRNGLEELIGTKVVNRYANQENGVLAQSNLNEKGMSINCANYYVEILKMDKDEPACIGELGRIVVTDLFNYAFPMIRYETGDLGILKRAGILETVQGRRVDMIYDTSGRALTPHVWSVYMWKISEIKQYQFIQKSKNEYLLKLNDNRKVYGNDEYDSILRSILGDDAIITIEYVDEIPVLASGKFKKTVCEYVPEKQEMIK